MALDLKQVRLEDLSDVRNSFWIGKHPGKPNPKKVLVIRFEGTFGIGSGGNDDADFMVAIGNAGIHAFGPHAIITDLSALSYEWGDMMGSVIDIGHDRRTPTALVVGSKCRQAIGTLCFGENSTNDACERESIFDSLNEAWQYVTTLLDEGAKPPLYEAASDGDLQRVEQLLESGEDPNRPDCWGGTPLHFAANPSIVKLLIEAGADASAKNLAGVTPLDLVKDVESARLLLDAGADPDARSSSNSSPLCGARSVAIAKLLIEAGADVLLRKRNSLLQNVRSPEIARVLIEAGADVNMVDEHGKTPLDRAEENHQMFYRQADRYNIKGDVEVARNYAEIRSLLRASGGLTGSEITKQRNSK
jgi:hypothetical protein